MWIFNKVKHLYLADLIPDQFIDIHCHILPGIDDGAQTPEDSISLINDLASINIRKFIATPHNIENVWENDPKTVEKSFEKLTSYQGHFAEKTSIALSSEYMLDNRFYKLLNTDQVVPILKKYLLVEMSYMAAPLNLYELLFEIQNAGFTPILAHPERYNFLHGKLSEYKKLKQFGCKFQLNLAAIFGYYGVGPKICADELLEAGLYDYVGTDTHHSKHTRALSQKFQMKKNEELKRIINANLEFSS